MPATTPAIQDRVLRAARVLQAGTANGFTISAIRRMDGELRHAAPMCYQTACMAVERLLDCAELREVPDTAGRLLTAMRQRRLSWTNEKRREPAGAQPPQYRCPATLARYPLALSNVPVKVAMAHKRRAQV